MDAPVNTVAAPAASTRFNALTGFRCIAACMVFVYHNRKYWRPHLHPELLRLINEFNIGVSLFFVLSGFLIAHTYQDKPLQTASSYTRYIALRMARIMPLYWLILTCYYADAAYGKHLFTWRTYTMVHGFSNEYNLEGISQAWSLNVEMCFYFLAPLLFFIQRKHWKWLLLFLLGLFAIIWGIGYTWHYINGNRHEYFYPLTFLLDASFPGRALEFFAGMMLALWYQHPKAACIWQLKYKTAIGFLGIIVTAYAIGLFEPDMYRQGTERAGGRLMEMLVLPAFVVTALAGLMSEQTWLSKILSSKLMVLLGNASFAFYLIHISYVNQRLQDWVMLPDRNFILLWCVAILLYLLYEKPVYEWCRKKLKKDKTLSR